MTPLRFGILGATRRCSYLGLQLRDPVSIGAQPFLVAGGLFT